MAKSRFNLFVNGHLHHFFMNKWSIFTQDPIAYQGEYTWTAR
jgi:hypothetical protein